MELETTTTPHDFEIVAKPEAAPTTDDQPLNNEQTKSEEDRSIKDLFNIGERPLLVQTAVKILIISSLPFILAWTTLVAVFKTLRSHETPSNSPGEEIIQKIFRDLQTAIDVLYNRLKWIDKQLPAMVEKYKKSAVRRSNDIIGDSDWSIISRLLVNCVRYCLIAVVLLLAHFVLPRVCPILGCSVHIYIPVWLWATAAYWYTTGKFEKESQPSIDKRDKKA